jgi:hypothetical protein
VPVPEVDEESGDEFRHPRVEIGAAAHDHDIAKLRFALAGEKGEDARPQRGGGLRSLQQLDQRQPRSGEHGVPSRGHGDIVGRQAGLFGKLAQQAAVEIDGVAAHVVGIGRAGREIELAGVGGMRRHQPEQERAVGTMQRAHRKADLDRPIGKIEGAPRQEAREIGFEKRAAQLIGGERMLVHHQHAAIPQRRLSALQLREAGVDLGAPLHCERPRPRHKAHRDAFDRDDRQPAHRARPGPSSKGRARNTWLGATSSSWAATKSISAAPSSAVRLRMPKIDDAASESASAATPVRR